jgi:hypothetical protein
MHELIRHKKCRKRSEQQNCKKTVDEMTHEEKIMP